MSVLPHHDPTVDDPQSCTAIDLVIVPRARNVGGIDVRRILPAQDRQMVGPFIFFDQIGPTEFLIGKGLNILPHPHIGVATLTYLFEGQMWHRDSLGTSVVINPGEVNFMIAGRGIVHSEREPDHDKEEKSKRSFVNSRRARIGETRNMVRELFGVQAWLALPEDAEENAPEFVHYDMSDLPEIAADGKCVRVILGEVFGKRSPVEFPHPAFFAEAVLEHGEILTLDASFSERSAYVATGALEISGERFEQNRLLVFSAGERINLQALTRARVLLLGGEPMNGPRHIWWNFVSSSSDRLEVAREDWRRMRFGVVPGDEKDYIPLPD